MNERDEELWVQANQLCHSQNVIKKFAELVRADEREECIKLCDEQAEKVGNSRTNESMAASIAAFRCASAIKERGEVK